MNIPTHLSIQKHKHWDSWQYEEAEKAGSFKSLLSYPCLLYRWQMQYASDVLPIAKIASHGLGHTLCKEKCNTIDRWMKKVLVKSLCIILIKKAETIGQLSFL